jgi:hypothetical protein
MKTRLVFLMAIVLGMAASGSLVAAAQTDAQGSPTGQQSGAMAQQQQGSTTNQQQTGTMENSQTSSTTDPADQSGSSLPRTASLLPLTGMGGLATLVAGLWLRRPRRKK